MYNIKKIVNAVLILWFEKSGCLKLDYIRLREIQHLRKFSLKFKINNNNPIKGKAANKINKINKIDILPAKLDTLKARLRRTFFIFKLIKKAVFVIIEKQPFLIKHEKDKNNVKAKFKIKVKNKTYIVKNT